MLSEPDWCRFAGRAVLADVAIPVMSTPVRWSGSRSSTSRRLLDASRVGEGGLLLVTGEAGLPIVGRDLHDEDGAFARHYHLGGAGVVLVRPGVRRLASFRARR